MNELEELITTSIGRDISKNENEGQFTVMNSDKTVSLFIVAGPGSGKTTAIVLRIMKLVLVDEIDTSEIMVTTFTRKAAKELESRILGWGDQLRRAVINDPRFSGHKDELENIDFTRIRVGTIDSLAQDVMGEYRLPGEIEPIIIEDFVSTSLMLRHVLFVHGRFKDTDLKNLLTDLKGTRYGLNTRDMARLLGVIKDRVNTDMVNINNLKARTDHPGIPKLVEVIEEYQNQLSERNLFDYGKLETEFLSQINSGKLDEFLSKIKFLLVDEYQDTNLLQESIYFKIANHVFKNAGSLTVVGDDDQALYRFRGSTVELFRDFPNRLFNNSSVRPQTVYLSRNYRSTKQVVDFVNSFIHLDPGYQDVRVVDKPQIDFNRRNTKEKPIPNLPVLGMFRNEVDQLSKDLSTFIRDVVQNGGYHLKDGRVIELEGEKGSLADIAFLASSPQESKSNRERLPLHLKKILEKGEHPLKIFNPRGASIEDDERLSRLNGLVLYCIDPKSEIQNGIEGLPKEIAGIFNVWRVQGSNYLSANNDIIRGKKLEQFVNEVVQHSSSFNPNGEPRSFSLIALIYQLITWMPDLHNDIEGLAYLELITRSIEQSSVLTPSLGTINLNPKDIRKERKSIEETLWNIFVPLATGAVDLNEELFETLPSNKINVMSFHQAKGLEFPLVIVDVGSDYRRNVHTQKMLRFPDNGGSSGYIEEFLKKSSPRETDERSQRDKAFDDLIRKFFVGYSRAKDCLLLVGLSKSRSDIPNVATGTLRMGEERWNTFCKEILEI